MADDSTYGDDFDDAPAPTPAPAPAKDAKGAGAEPAKDGKGKDAAAAAPAKKDGDKDSAAAATKAKADGDKGKDAKDAAAAKPKADAAADAKPKADAPAAPAPAAPAKADVKADAKADAKTDAKADAKADSGKPEAKPDAKADAKADPKPDTKADAKSDAPRNSVKSTAAGTTDLPAAKPNKDAAAAAADAAKPKDTVAAAPAAADAKPAAAAAAAADTKPAAAEPKPAAAAAVDTKPAPTKADRPPSAKKSSATVSTTAAAGVAAPATAPVTPASPGCHGSIDIGVIAGCAKCKALSASLTGVPATAAPLDSGASLVDALRKEADLAAAADSKTTAPKAEVKAAVDTTATPSKADANPDSAPSKSPAPAAAASSSSPSTSTSKPSTAAAAAGRASTSALSAVKPPSGATKRSASLHRNTGSNGSTGSTGSGPRSSSPSPSPAKPPKAGTAASGTKLPRTSTAASDSGAKRPVVSDADKKKNDALAAKARARKEAQMKAEAETKAKKSTAPTMGPARDSSPTRQLMFSATPVPAADQSQYARSRTGAAVDGAAAGAAGHHSRAGHSVDWSVPQALERPISPLADLKLEDLPQDVVELRQKLHDTQKKLNTYKGKFKAAQSQIATYKQTENVKNWDKLQTMATTNDQLRAQLKEIMAILDDKISVNEPVAARYQKVRANASYLVHTTNDGSAAAGPGSPAANEKGGPASAAWGDAAKSPGLTKSPSADTKDVVAGSPPPPGHHVRGGTAAGSVASVGRVSTAGGGGGIGLLARQGTGLGSTSEGERANLEKLLKIQLNENQRLKKTLENLDPVRLQELENQLAARNHELTLAKKEVTTLKTALASKEKGLIRAAQNGTSTALDIRGGTSTFGASDEAVQAKQAAGDLKVLKEKVRQYMERHVRDERLLKSYHTQLFEMRAAHNALLIKTGQKPLPAGMPPQTAGGSTLGASASTAAIIAPVSPTNAAAAAGAGAGAGAAVGASNGKVSMNGAGDDKDKGKHHRSHSNVKHHSPKHSHDGGSNHHNKGSGKDKDTAEHNAADTVDIPADDSYGNEEFS